MDKLKWKLPRKNSTYLVAYAIAENFRIDVARGSADQPTVGSDSRLAFVFQAV